MRTDRGSSVPLFCDGFQAGVLKAHVATTLIQYPNVFESVCEVGVPMTSVCEVGVAVTSEVGVAAVTAVRVAESLRTVEERTAAVNSVFSDLRDKGVFSCLRGWRNEVCTSNYITVGVAVLYLELCCCALFRIMCCALFRIMLCEFAAVLYLEMCCCANYAAVLYLELFSC